MNARLTRVIAKLQRSDLRMRLIENVRQRMGKDRPNPNLESFSREVEEARRGFGQAGSHLTQLFLNKQGRTIDKWVHYIPVYERYLSQYRGTSFSMLEIGVFQGGSLELWREYFGSQATFFGIDINPECAGRVEAPNQVRIGSQADPEFLKRVVGEMGGIDVVIDDGSHISEHQRVSFDTLFPLLAEGGLYIIEDLHTAYWRETWNGGYRRPGTAIEVSKSLIDDMHHWYHGRDLQLAFGDKVSAVHMYDSIVVIEKGAGAPPVRTRVGAKVAAR